jgi:hypothetical protein
VDIGLEIDGWYQDPYRRHEHRWLSNGRPTALVRDDGTTSHDEPPDEPFTGPLVPADDVAVPDETMRAGDGPNEADMPATMYGVMPDETTW